MPDETPSPHARTPSRRPRLRARRIFETSVYGPDPEQLLGFYRRVLGLELISRFGESGSALRCGDGVLLLFDPDVTASTSGSGGDVASHGARGPGHICFAVPAEELHAWRDHLERCDVAIETEVEWENGRSLYFRDPAGNSVELATPAIWDAAHDEPAVS